MTEVMTDDPTFGGMIADPAGLQAWFDANVPGEAGPIALTRVKGGASNVLFQVRRGDERYALRRPPRTSNDPTANNTVREIQLLAALGKTQVRHARMVAAATETAPVGTPFVVMRWVDGFTPWDPMPEPFASDPAVRRQMGFEVVDAITDVANMDWRAAGLEGFGKPDGFLERQVDRWLGQLERYRTLSLIHI